uniref:Putative GPI-anchored protein PB15E9.01c n=2 Tax=Lygus hesperus TaxID=30085 RepID=A0A0A9X1H7_LYGHE
MRGALVKMFQMARRALSTTPASTAITNTTVKPTTNVSGIDFEIVSKFPELRKVLRGRMVPQELPTYELRVAYFLATHGKGQSLRRRMRKKSKQRLFQQRVEELVQQQTEDDVNLRMQRFRVEQIARIHKRIASGRPATKSSM